MLRRTRVSAPALHRARQAKTANPVTPAHQGQVRRASSIMVMPAPAVPRLSSVVGRRRARTVTSPAPAKSPVAAAVSTCPMVAVPAWGSRMGLSSTCTMPMVRVMKVMTATSERTLGRAVTARQPPRRWSAAVVSWSAVLRRPTARMTAIEQATVTRQVEASRASSPRSPTRGRRRPASSGDRRYRAEEAAWSSPALRT